MRSPLFWDIKACRSAVTPLSRTEITAALISVSPPPFILSRVNRSYQAFFFNYYFLQKTPRALCFNSPTVIKQCEGIFFLFNSNTESLGEVIETKPNHRVLPETKPTRAKINLPCTNTIINLKAYICLQLSYPLSCLKIP